jgi:hypothetical protein
MMTLHLLDVKPHLHCTLSRIEPKEFHLENNLGYYIEATTLHAEPSRT